MKFSSVRTINNANGDLPPPLRFNPGYAPANEKNMPKWKDHTQMQRPYPNEETIPKWGDHTLRKRPYPNEKTTPMKKTVHPNWATAPPFNFDTDHPHRFLGCAVLVFDKPINRFRACDHVEQSSVHAACSLAYPNNLRVVICIYHKAETLKCHQTLFSLEGGVWVRD